MTDDPGQSYSSEFVRLGPRTSGVLRVPARRGPEARVGVVTMHTTSDHHNHPTGTELAARGFCTLGANGRFVNQPEGLVITEELPLDLAHAVRFMREQPGIERVALAGHSGGGELVALYGNLAENGPAVSRGPEKLTQASDELAGLPPVDAVVLLDAHPGGNRATYLDPAVTDEDHPERRDPALDMYAEANGYDRAGAHYSDDFKRRFYRAQAERMNRLIAMALDRRSAIEAGKSAYPDTEPFPIARVGARLLQADLSQVSHAKSAYPILKPDGSQVVEVPHSVRGPSTSARRNLSYADGFVGFSVQSFLSFGALRATDSYCVTDDSIEGLDWTSTNLSSVANVAGIRVPSLIVAMGAHYFIVPSEMYYERSPSTDKSMVMVEGATHGFRPFTAAEPTPGAFGDTLKTTFDYVASWLRQRFV